MLKSSVFAIVTIIVIDNITKQLDYRAIALSSLIGKILD